jgi:hypothetical protein
MRRCCRQWPIATFPPELTVYLTMRPFLHLGPRIAGAQAQSRCSPPRWNDLDGAEHRHTINTAGTAAPPKPHGKTQGEHSITALPRRQIRWQLPAAGRLAAPFDRPRICKSFPTHTM